MILQTMLHRLYASLVHGPSMNARPHNSRQRIDLTALSAFGGRDPQGAIKELLERGSVEFPAKVPRFEPPEYPEAEWSEEERKARAAAEKQRRLLEKLRGIAVDAQDYYNDHGESGLALGFPLISIPPSDIGRGNTQSSRIIAPIAFVPLEMQVRTGSRPGITLKCLGEGAELLVANPALLAWLEQQSGISTEGLFQDDDGADPWRELTEIVAHVLKATKIEPTVAFGPETAIAAVPETADLPKQAALLSSCVLGLFPLVNQAALRDTRWMSENESSLEGPVNSFLRQEALAGGEDTNLPEAAQFSIEEQARVSRDFSQEWLVSHADPCQANAVAAARSSQTLVIHGPPGTGKSQTIANVIGDHLARGQRVLFVCDKRTALDVVKYRLDALGIGHLCGVVHDPTLDRRDLYMQLRGRLETLVEDAVPPSVERELSQVNDQLQRLHSELTGYRTSLQLPAADGASFHDLLGGWLELSADSTLPLVPAVPNLTVETLEQQRTSIGEILRRSERAQFGKNPFRGTLGIAVAEFLAKDLGEVRAAFSQLREHAAVADAVFHAELVPISDGPFAVQADARRKVATLLQSLTRRGVPDLCARLGQDTPQASALLQEFRDAEDWVGELGAPLDRELDITCKSTPISLSEISRSIQAIDAYLPISSSWKRFIAFGPKKAASDALSPVGLLLSDDSLSKAARFYKGLRARLLLSELIHRASGAESTARLPDEDLRNRSDAIREIQEVRSLLQDPAAQVLAPYLTTTFSDMMQWGEGMASNLQASAEWLEKGDLVLGSAAATQLFSEGGLSRIRATLTEGRSGALAASMGEQMPSLEEMVRVEASLSLLPPDLRPTVEQLAAEGAGLDEAFASLRKGALENTMRSRIRSDAALAAVDGDRIEAAFSTLLDLTQRKQELVRQSVRNLWLKRAKDRLLSSTGTQLNKTGASLKQRLFVRGKKALRLRQMIVTGLETEGGDPLYDLCPIWMASPSTVAQVFPRAALFDLIIFDEASQCRLEECLPVLLRGNRVVVAGDPKQLPPTRFFEASLADSSQTDPETGEELFQIQQSEAEDLLSASLNLDAREAFLDVHYRSRNEALIGFSNESFYHDRLQPIPGHPKNRASRAPIILHRVDGIYEQRTNEKEAERAVDLVAELLDEKNPPSIGVACFNLTQRDAIVEALEKRAQADAQFASRLAEARTRRGRDSFEGLFVKNLENVQGDERDVMIISTTFGPDPNGKFRRAFGALSQQNGGRRLNVLVTRARSAIHVLTSIPRSEYVSPESLPDGRQMNGRHHLYGYLRYAERLASLFEQYSEALEKMKRDHVPQLEIQDTPTASTVAQALGRALHLQHGIGSTIHWGNEGFCVDAALTHPEMPVDVTIGVLTDFTRFRKTPDPIEWDLFRTMVLRSQGWELERVWSPSLFRNANRVLNGIAARHEKVADRGAAESDDAVVA